MKKIFLLLGVFTTLFSCSAIDEMLEKFSGDYVENVEMTVEDFEEDATTRTALSNLTDTGAKFAWAENDTVGIFPNVGDQVSFSMSAGAGTSSATFNGGGWALRTSSSYSAYYPFSRANFYRDSKTIAINMVGQTQNGNDDTSEIGAFDIMAAAPASAETGNVKFAFKHQVSICRIKLTLPENKSFKSVKVIAPSKKFITEAKLDISVATPTITATKTSEEISLSLRNFSTTSTNKELIANMYVLPVDMSADKLIVKVTDVDDNVYTAENVTGVNFEKAKIRILNAVPTPDDGDDLNMPLTFTALEDNSTIALSNYGSNKPNVEYSFDKVNWITWDYSTLILAKDQKVYMRGENTSFSTRDYPVNYSNFSMTGKIAASGNIMSLLYSTGFDTNTSLSSKDYCFYRLFFDCTSLTRAPELPATTLAWYCYAFMFYGCTNLTKAPILPATNLDIYCYQSMFYGCTNLTTPPALPAMRLKGCCYAGMFAKCTSLTEAPELPATTLADQCYSSMFYGCTNLKTIKMAARDISAALSLDYWLYGVSSTGTFYKNKNATWDVTGSSGIPSGWTVIEYEP